MLCDTSFLEYVQVHIGLEQSALGGLQAPIPPIQDVLRSETDQTGQTYHSLSFAPTFPRINAHTPTHTQLT